MEYKELKKIFDTLPIGYYLGRALNVELSETEQSSYFDPYKDRIIVSYPMLQQLKNYSGESDIRALLYHEISHAILTPKNLMQYVGYSDSRIVNIFEDERIETLLKNYYLNVDFKNFVKKVGNWDIKKVDLSKMKNPDYAYYACVRFDYGTQENLKIKNDLIAKWKNLNASISDYYIIRNYIDDIKKFYQRFNNKDKKEQLKYGQNNFKNHIKQLENAKNNAQKDLDIIKEKMENEQDENIKNMGKTAMNNIQNEMKDLQNRIDSSKKELDKIEQELNEIEKLEQDSEKELSDLIESGEQPLQPSQQKENGCGITKGEITDIVNSILENAISKEIYETMYKALFQKENRHKTGGYNTYSGKINPRIIANDYNKNYKWFDRTSNNGDLQNNSKLILNLFIDNSGSMGDNTNKVNGILKSLRELKKIDRNFDFNVVTIGSGLPKIQPKDYTYVAGGGSRMYKEIKNIVDRLNQNRNDKIYNITIMDGGFNEIENLKCLDKNNSVIISDSENSYYINNNIKVAKTKIVDSDYVNVFEKELSKLIKQVIR